MQLVNNEKTVGEKYPHYGLWDNRKNVYDPKSNLVNFYKLLLISGVVTKIFGW